MTGSEQPPRWLDDEAADPRVRRLIASARGDGPSTRALTAAPAAIAALIAAEKAALAAGLSAAGGAGAKLASGASTATFGIVAKWVGLGALVGASASAVAYEYKAAVSAPTELTPAAASPGKVVAGDHAVSRARASALVDPEPSPSASAPVVAATVQARRALPHEAAREAVADDKPVERELELLDEARNAMSTGEPAQALAALDQAEQLRVRALGPEATVLRVRALMQLGRQGEARALAEQFLRRSPRAPQARVLSELLDEMR